MNRKAHSAALAAALVMFAIGAAGPALGGSKSIDLPPDGVPLKPSALPGYAKTQAICTACHSAEYLQYQSASVPRAYWEAMTKRMKLVFKAPVADDDIPSIVDYLATTYGNEQTQ